jgi:hypothetical protein
MADNLSEDDVKLIMSMGMDTSEAEKGIEKVQKKANEWMADLSAVGTETVRHMEAKQGMIESMTAASRQALPQALLGRKEDLPEALDARTPMDKIGGVLSGMFKSDNMSGMMGALIGGEGGGGMLGEIGGALGGAELGPFGAIIGALVKNVPQLIAAPAKMLTGSLQTVSDAFKQLSGPLGPIGAGLGLVSKGMEVFSNVIKGIPIIGEIFGPLLDALGKIPGIIKDMMESLTSFAELAAPSQVKMMNIEIRNFMATIGASFVPVVQLMTSVIRDLGDIIANIIPNAQEVQEALAWFPSFMQDWKRTAEELGPILREFLIANLKLLGVVAHLVAIEIEGVVIAFRILFATLTMGLSEITLAMMKAYGALQPKRARTMAAQPASISGIEEYQKQLQISAFSQGGATMTDKVDGIGKGVDKMNATLERIGTNIWELLKLATPWGMLKGIDKAVNGVPGRHNEAKFKGGGTVVGGHHKSNKGMVFEFTPGT